MTPPVLADGFFQYGFFDIGTFNYNTNPMDLFGSSGWHKNILDFWVEQSPHVLVMETHYKTMVASVMDEPSTHPVVDVIPYYEKDNRLLVNLNPGLGSYEKEAIAISNEDVTQIADIKQAQAVYLDGVFPNTKYYYTFRSVDIHGVHSHPTDIYEVEIVNDGSGIYPIIKNFSLKEKKTKTKFKSMKKYIQISPSLGHAVLGDSPDPTDGDYNTHNDAIEKTKLGLKDSSVWDKKIKIRITSAHTGKKIDLNVKFNILRQKRYK